MYNARTKNDSKQLSEETDLVQLSVAEVARFWKRRQPLCVAPTALVVHGEACPALALHEKRSGQTGWAKLCRAFGALEPEKRRQAAAVQRGWMILEHCSRRDCVPALKAFSDELSTSSVPMTVFPEASKMGTIISERVEPRAVR